jgi:hypothetical protein
LVKAFTAQGKEAEKTSEKINQITVDLYNLKKEAKDFSGLVDQFKELQNQSFKTSEELKEMEDILSKIKEYGGNQYDFVLAGQLDMDAVNLFMEAKELERQGKIAELREQGGEAVNNALSESFTSGRISSNLNAPIPTAQQPAVVEFLASTLYSNYDELEKEEQELIKSMISKNIDFYVAQYRSATERIPN